MNKYKFLFFAVLFLSFSVSSYGQGQGQENSVIGDNSSANKVMYSETAGLLTSTMLRVNYDYGLSCQGCGDSTESSYSCTDGQGWNDGIQSFTDPVPSGEVLKSIEISYQLACTAGNYDVYLNNELIGQAVSPGDACSCGCGVTVPVISAVFETGIPGYVYGGSNTIRIDYNGNNFSPGLCVYYADLLFDSSMPAAPIPTLSQWGIIALFLLFLIIGIVNIKNYSSRKNFAKIVD